ncbi:MAG: thymidylate synthase [Clostridia bacterium]|jgi:thymidylate synthase
MLPVLCVRGLGLAEAYEKALLTLYEQGTDLPTDYDKEGDPKSKDCTMIIAVEKPLSEPMIHRCFPGGLYDLEEYRQEVLDGIKDEFVRNPDDPKDHRWLYTYHQRLEKQIPLVLNELARNSFTRRANMTTWQAENDILSEDPPCLQRLWYRCTEEKGRKYLNCNVSMRSNDAFKASFMNMFAFIMLQKRIAEELSRRLNEEISVGQYTHMADSFHIYGSDLPQFEKLFLNSIKNRSFEDRTYTLEFCQPFFEEAKVHIRQKLEQMRTNAKTDIP